jgi:protocatechuate 3,4-dioxygenase, alpha subunit
LLGRLPTRVYFHGDPALAEDALLLRVPEDRRQTLIAQPDPASPGCWEFEIRFQGERETVFFDI